MAGNEEYTALPPLSQQQTHPPHHLPPLPQLSLILMCLLTAGALFPELPNRVPPAHAQPLAGMTNGLIEEDSRSVSMTHSQAGRQAVP